MSRSVFCVACLSKCCLHIQQNHDTMLTPREMSILCILVRPEHSGGKQIAHALGITEGTLRVYMGNVYRKLGWAGGSARKLVLWSIAHREQLGIELPTREQFLPVARKD